MYPKSNVDSRSKSLCVRPITQMLSIGLSCTRRRDYPAHIIVFNMEGILLNNGFSLFEIEIRNISDQSIRDYYGIQHYDYAVFIDLNGEHQEE